MVVTQHTINITTCTLTIWLTCIEHLVGISLEQAQNFSMYYCFKLVWYVYVPYIYIRIL